VEQIMSTIRNDVAIRASIGHFLFTPVGVNEHLLELAGFEVLSRTDTTRNVATIAGRWSSARTRYAKELRALEGDEAFEAHRRFLDTAATLARERRLSRFTYLAMRS
jgi:hypothetical protein